MPSYDLGIATFEASKPEVNFDFSFFHPHAHASLDLFEEVKDLDLLPSGYTVVAPPSEQQDRLHRALKASVGSILFAMTPCPDAPCATMLPPHQSSHNCQLSDSLELAVAKRWIWETGQTIRVRFLNGTPDVHEKVRKWGTQWLEYANLRMDFVDESDTDPVDIRISFDKDKPTRSCIGTLCRGVAQDEATMNFDDPAAAEFEGVVLHEFGHALGCIHEHQSPAGGISWDKPFLYGYYSIMCELTKADVDNNILYRYTDADIKEMNLQNSSFDRQSVMMYEIKPRMTTDNMTVERCQKLSAWDKHFIAAAYPPKTIGKENVNVLDDRGGFPLYWAAAGGHLDDVEDLLDNRGADVNLRTEFDWTALHWAAGNGHVAVVRHLLLYGARVNVFSDTNKTPLDLARINGNSEIIKLLEKAAEKQAKAEVPAHGPVV
ncbi:hypothetical protein QBC40DRAFT_336683 [Triangularia verruculosa]|uniref:Peptidase metallopeptidase domain-containing protein n=1 Tax=Triangularia verruculosa TaxID=2587418 RepID=A0AAN6XQK3_9PEZI|nr:hypothetical protein QBC40DRAFT_336683 [Triangularia verruculosa]